MGRRVAVDAIEIDESNAEHAERAVVERGLAVRNAVVGGEGGAVVGRLETDLLPDGSIARVGGAEDHRVAEKERGEIGRGAGRVLDGVAAGEREEINLRLGDGDGAREPAQR